jgi:uncharacterized protein YndB with AHSA1/START domain
MGAVSSLRRQALIEAPIDAVWRLVGDPARYPEWAGGVLEVTGLATVEKGTRFQQKSRLPVGTTTTTFLVEDFEDMHEIRLRCLDSGLYSRWLLTEARGATFTDVEIGMDPERLAHRAVDAIVGKRWYRRIAEDSLRGLRQVAGRERAVS